MLTKKSYKAGEAVSKNSSNHIFAIIANFFECWRLLIGFSAESTYQVSKIQKKFTEEAKIWVDDFFLKIPDQVWIFKRKITF